MKKKTDWLILLLILIILALIALGAFLAYRAHIERSSHQTLSRMADEVTDQIRELKEEEEITEQAIVIYSPDTPSQPETEEEQNREDLIVDLSPQAETESIPAEMQSEQLSEADACLSGQAGNSTFSVPRSHQVIFVGDSRTVGMGKAEAHFGDHCTYVGESGEGYRWFIEEGIDLMDQAIRKHPKSPVIFNLGVNDCDHIDAYIEVYHEIEKVSMLHTEKTR